MVAINETMNQVYINSKNGDKTFIFIYYAGHGACDNNTYVITGGGKMFALEKSIRILGRMPESYVISLFDCCREKIDEGQWRGAGPNYVNIEAMMEDLGGRDQDDGGNQKGFVNTIVTYGCPPSQGVPAKSTIALSYFRQLKMSADSYDGMIKFPSVLNFYTGIDGKCETISKVKAPLFLKW